MIVAIISNPSEGNSQDCEQVGKSEMSAIATDFDLTNRNRLNATRSTRRVFVTGDGFDENVCVVSCIWLILPIA